MGFGPGEEEASEIVKRFHRLYYRRGPETWKSTTWFGARALKCPLDLWMYQEILQRMRPDVIVETGTAEGGSAAFLAFICDLLGHGRVLTIDVEPLEGRPEHERITYLEGSSVDPEILASVRESIASDDRVMVILDSDHSHDHVLAELRAYAPMVSEGGYLIVEDTNLNGHPILPGIGPRAMEAVQEFVAEDERVEIDRDCEKFFLTFNPGGYLRRRSQA